MKLKDKLESCEIIHDDKARRRLNISKKTPNISIESLDAGVTIEQLESLNVPVLQYKTQITIHGIFKSINPDFLPKGLILNQNKSLGVRYASIDFEKKQTLLEISRMKKSSWHMSINSSGCSVYKTFKQDQKQDVLNCYNRTDDSLYIGEKGAYSLFFGGFAVILNIGAIYQNNFWKFSEHYFNVSEEEYNKYQEQQQREEEVYQEKVKKAKEQREEIVKEKTQALIDAGYKHPAKFKPGYYVRFSQYNLKYIVVYVTGNKRLLCKSHSVESIEDVKPFEVTGKKHAVEHSTVMNWFMLKDNSKTKLDNSYVEKYDGDWTWISTDGIPPYEQREQLKDLGGSFNRKRKQWLIKSHIEKEQLSFLT